MNPSARLAGLVPARRMMGAVAGLAFLLLAAMCALPAQAASLQVAPISLEFAPRDVAQGIWLSNSGSTPLRAQVRVQQWSQSENQDRLAATRELVASPPAVDIPPGEKQLVRIIRMQASAPVQEQTFRLIIDELPPSTAASAAAGVDGAKPAGLQFLLRYSVPVFVGASDPVPATPKPSDLSAISAAVLPSGPEPVLAMRNAGARRVKVSQLTFVAADGQRTPLFPGLVGYVLAGQRMQWPLKTLAPQAVQALQAGGVLKAKFNADLDEQVLPLVNGLP